MASAATITANHQPLILDFDHSVSDIEHARICSLEQWQESIRFACSHKQLQQLELHLASCLSQHSLLPATDPGCIFLGSGDFHHLTYLLLRLLLRRLPQEHTIQLIVCDNHPDNMYYPFGIHCGSWVYWASQLPQITAIHLLGITSMDIGWQHALENRWRPLRTGKLTYWSCGVNSRWLHYIGASQSSRMFSSADQLVATFIAELSAEPIYLSIDKDVLSKEVIQTNWDQGIFNEHHLQQLIQACQGKIVAADITGDVSIYHYKSRLKRLLSACDGQKKPSITEITAWQQQQNALNNRLLHLLDQAWKC